MSADPILIIAYKRFIIIHIACDGDAFSPQRYIHRFDPDNIFSCDMLLYAIAFAFEQRSFI
jgi:hypothetical protein